MGATKSAAKAQSNTPMFACKAKPARRDPEKRREQNRQSQKTYREKQRKRVEELERRVAASGLPPSSSKPQPFSQDRVSDLVKTVPPNQFDDIGFPDVIDPSILQPISSSSDMLISNLDTSSLPLDFDFWLQEDHQIISSEVSNSSGVSMVFFDCGCSTIHVPMPASPFLLPIIPVNPYINSLRLDVECVLDALLRNCMHLGIAKGSFCADEAESHFYRPNLLPPASSSSSTSPSSSYTMGEDGEVHVPDETSKLVASTRSMFRTLKYDLRPLESQITKSHHPYIDALPFRDMRENLIELSLQDGVIDEDELLHDFFNHARCWGGVKGSKGQGTPWEARSWEASEAFLRKWAVVVGGDDGELARQSRWWRSMRGERVEEII